MRDESLWFQTHKSIRCSHTRESDRRFASTVLFVLSRLVHKSIITKQNKPRKTQSISWAFIAHLFDDPRAHLQTHTEEYWDKRVHFSSWKVISCCSPSKKNNARKAGPAKLPLCLASSMENFQKVFFQWLPFSAPHQISLQGVKVVTMNTPNYLWTLDCIQNVVKVPFLFSCLCRNKNFIRLRYILFAEPKHFSSGFSTDGVHWTLIQSPLTQYWPRFWWVSIQTLPWLLQT